MFSTKNQKPNCSRRAPALPPCMVQKEFCGIPASLQESRDIPRNSWKSGENCTKKRSLFQLNTREMSNSATRTEKRQVHACGLLLRILSCARVQPRLLSATCKSFQEYLQIPAKRLGFPRVLFSTREGHSAGQIADRTHLSALEFCFGGNKCSRMLLIFVLKFETQLHELGLFVL